MISTLYKKIFFVGAFVLLVGIFFITIKIIKGTTNIKMIHNSTKSSFKINRLYVKGEKLYTENGNSIVLRGLTAEVFRWERGEISMDEFFRRLELIKLWGINAIQLYINPRLFDIQMKNSVQRMRELDKVIKWGKDNNIYIIINPVNDIVWKNHLPIREDGGIAVRDSIPLFLENLASKFNSENVLYGIEAEPKFIDTEEQINIRISAIRKYSQNPIIVSIQNFNGSLSLVEAIPRMNDKNIIIDDHPYFAKNILDYNKQIVNLDSINIFLDSINVFRVDKNLFYPFLIGEYGGFWQDDFNTPEDIQIIKAIGCWANYYEYSQFGYSIDNKVLSMFDRKGALTLRGKAIKEILSEKTGTFCSTNYSKKPILK